MLRIIDDGIGIAANNIVKPMSHGLLGMRERALLLGGTLTIRRGRNDAGTCIEVSIPLRNRPQAEERRADMTTTLPPAISEVLSSVLHPPADARIPSEPPCSTHPHTPPSLTDQAQ